MPQPEQTREKCKKFKLTGGRQLAPSWRMAIASALIAFTTPLALAAASTKEASPAKPDKDWPCRQILVGRISLPTVWSGPSIDAVDWRGDAAIAGFVARLAARRMPLDAAERSIEEFAKAAGPDRPRRMTALFAGLFETLNGERVQVIEGLMRFGRKQKELAERIRSENALMQAGADAASAREDGQEAKSVAQNLEWDLRIFDERRQSLTYVCETPTLIEQRLFALARIIQNNLD